MGQFDGKVVLVTGVARGQGRSHAVRFAEEGASILGMDVAAPIGTPHYPPSTPDDLAETEKLIEKTGARCIIRQGDVRDQEAINKLVEDGLAEFGRIDILIPNAGIVTLGPVWELTEDQWQEMVDINLTGVWRTLRAGIPALIDGGRGGSIVMTGSIAGIIGMPGLAHYAATKHGVNALVKSLANELAPYNIRVNSVNPTNVKTPMIINPGTYQTFRPDVPGATLEDAIPAFKSYNILDTPYIEPNDVSDSVLFLASEQAKWITGAMLPVDTGTVVKWPGA